MKKFAPILAVLFFLIALLYALGVVSVGASAGHAHHYSHAVVFAVLGALCLVWARFKG